MTLRFAATLLLLTFSAAAQQSSPKILKIDPPDWWAQMPAPMLLIRGENLSGATASLNDRHLHISSTRISENGHWAELWLSQSPPWPETVTITIKTPYGTTSAPYKFAQKRAESDGFAGFHSADVMYLIMTDRFADGDPTNDRQQGMPYDRKQPRAWHGGDIRGIQQHLDYLQDLGVNTVWLTPVTQNREPDSYHGYGTTDMYSVDDHFGALADLRSLADEMHSRGMKLVLDTVPNHVGPAHPWVDDSPTPDWFHGTKAHHRIATGNFPALMDPSASERDRRDVLEGWFVDLLPDLNQENPVVSKYLIQNTIWWVESTGADGLRIDTFPYVGRKFWHDFHLQLTQIYPKLTEVGEVFTGELFIPPALNAFFAGGVVQSGRTSAVDTGLFTPFDYPLYAVLRDVLIRNAPMTNISLLLGQDSLYPHPERLATLLGSHDTKRFLGEEQASPGELRLAFGMLFTLRGMPVIYAGDEIGMKGGDDPDNRRDFPGGFPQQNAGFHNAFVAAEREDEEATIHNWVKQLLTIRSHNPELETGQQQIEQADSDTMSYVRGKKLEHGCSVSSPRVLVVVNKSPEVKTVSIDTAETALAGCTQFVNLLGNSQVVKISPEAINTRVGSREIMLIRLQ